MNTNHNGLAKSKLSKPRLLCIGSANADRKIYASKKYKLHVTNESTTHFTFGGVARNVAENISKLDFEVSLMTCVGDDIEGQLLKKSLFSKGIGAEHTYVLKNSHTCMYTALIDEDGELFVAAVSNRDIYNFFTKDEISKCLSEVSRPDYIFLDAIMDEKCLDYVLYYCKSQKIHLTMNLISPSDALNCPKRLDGVSLLTANEAEASSLSGISVDSQNFCESTAGKIHEKGVSNVVITFGESGLYCSDGTKGEFLPAHKIKVVDVVGAGDSFIGGLLYSHNKGANLIDMCKYGTAAAYITIQSPDTVSQLLTPHYLESTTDRYFIAPAN